MPPDVLLYASGRSTPRPLASDGAVILFRGTGRARFRIQHGRDRGGRPDRLSWADVSNMSNALLAEEHAVDAASSTVIGGVLADFVEGDQMVIYRRHGADWIRVIPFDHLDKANLVACRNYVVTMSHVVSLESFTRCRTTLPAA